MNPGTLPDPRDADWRGEIEQLEEEGRRAFLAQDVATLERLMSADFIVNSPLNRIHTRDQVLDLLSRGVIRHLSYDVHIELLQRHGDVVFVMGRDVVTNPPDAVPLHRRFTNVWEPAGGSWRMIGRHAQPIPSH
jgi:ketosteroid isomerase-like protein